MNYTILKYKGKPVNSGVVFMPYVTSTHLNRWYVKRASRNKIIYDLRKLDKKNNADISSMYPHIIQAYGSQNEH